MLEVQGVRVDPATGRAWLAEVELELARKEFQLLHALMERAGEVVTRAELMAEVWNVTFYTTTKTIDVHLGWLRRKLGDDPRSPRFIQTVRGRGLCFLERSDEPEQPVQANPGSVDAIAALAPDLGGVDASVTGDPLSRARPLGLTAAE